MLPQEELAALLTADYTAMQGMILGDAPPFDELLNAIGEFEARLNASAGKTRNKVASGRRVEPTKYCE